MGAPVEKLNPIGVGLALASTMIYSIYLPALEYVQEGVPAMFATFLLILGAAVTFVIAAALTKELFTPRDASVWMNIILLAVVSTVIGVSPGASLMGKPRVTVTWVPRLSPCAPYA